MFSVQKIIHSLTETSKRISAKGHIEQSSLQEAMAILCGMFLVDGGAVDVIGDNAITNSSKMQLSSIAVVGNFAEGDLKVGLSEDGQKLVVLYMVESKYSFEGMPLFLQNYLAEGMFPCMLCLVAEQVDIYGLGKEKEFFALPYFPIIDLSGQLPNPTIAFVGDDNRKKVRENPAEATQEAMSNLHVYTPLISTLLSFTRSDDGQ